MISRLQENITSYIHIYDNELSSFLERANAHKQLFLTALNALYKDEIKPDHKLTLFHAKRHEKKIEMALELKAVCETPCVNLKDINDFILLISRLKNINNTIDKKGGRFGAILDVVNDLAELRTDVIRLQHNKKTMAEYILTILNSIIGLKLVGEQAADLHKSLYDASEYDPIIKYYEPIILHYEQYLVEKQMQQVLKWTEVALQPDVNEIKVRIEMNKVVGIFQSMRDLDLKGMERCVIPCLLAKSSSPSSSVDQASISLFRLIIDTHINRIGIEEKALFFKNYIVEKNNIDGRVSPTMHDEKLAFYLNGATIAQPNLLRLKELETNLNSIVIPQNVDNLIELVRESMNDYIDLLASRSDIPAGYKKHFLLEWTRKLGADLTKLCESLKNADLALKHGVSDDTDPFIADAVVQVRKLCPGVSASRVLNI